MPYNVKGSGRAYKDEKFLVCVTGHMYESNYVQFDEEIAIAVSLSCAASSKRMTLFPVEFSALNINESKQPSMYYLY